MPLFTGVVVSALLFTCGTTLGQTTGSIEGRATDSSGAPLPGVTVEATSPSLQGTRAGITGRDGAYRFPAVPPGTYWVRASLPGFRTAEKTATVSLDATATVDLSLQPAAAEQIVVSGEAPLVDLTSTTTGTNYTRAVITHLPVSRNYADIVRSNPGIEPDRGETQGRSISLAIYGATSAEHQWIIDGVNTTNVIRGMQGKAINNEFVQEVEVKTGGYQAEYGRALGGVINVITKSGGNTFHGDGFVYYDSSALAAERKVTSEDSLIFDMRIVDYRRTDFGVDLGGYLWKDRLWFFGAYNRVELPAEVSRYVASALVSTEDRFPLKAADNLYSGKLTWNISAGSTAVASIFSDPTTNTGAAGADPRQGFGRLRVRPITNPDPSTWDSTRHIGAIDYSGRLNQLFGSRALVTLQASRHNDRYELTAADQIRTRDFTCAGGTVDDPCQIPPVENFVTGGYGFIIGFLSHNSSRRDQFRADNNLYIGNHEIKLGGDYQIGKTDSTDSFTGGQLIRRFNERGQVYYQHNFFVTSIDPLDLTPAAGYTVRPRTADYGAYIQDSWKPAPQWTINVGLRWDEEDIRDYRDVTVIRTKNEWQPRIGIVWDPTRDGRTKVHAFAGRFYYALPTDLSVRSYGNDSSAVTFNFDPVDVTPDPNVPGHPRSFLPYGAFGDPVDPNLRGIFQDEYTVGVDRALSSTLTVGLKATYRRLGSAIEDRCDLDYNRPETGFNSCGLMNPGSDGPIARGNIPWCNGLDEIDTDGDGTPDQRCFDTGPAVPPVRRLYRGIEVVARKSVGERLWLQASYVYSSLRGNYDGEVSEAFFGQTDPGINADFDYSELSHNGYGRLFLDRPHRFRLDGYYTTPFKLSVGFQTFVRSGAPLNKFGYLNFFYGPIIQLVPRGYAGRLPTEWEANLSLAYPITVGPATVTLQAYLFNLFNNQIATSRETAWTINPPDGYPASLYDPNQEPHNPEYGKVTTRGEPRLFRAAIRVSF
jgi:hypothetical protein